MSLRSILVPMNAASGDRAALDLALTVALPFDAHIQALFVRPDPREAIAAMGMGIDGVTIDRVMDEVEQDGARASKRAHESFDQWRTQRGLGDVTKTGAPSAQWRELQGVPDRIIAQLGGTSDLIVETGLADKSADGQQVTIEASLFASGRPVLVAPHHASADPFSAALVAWNGSVEANHAVAGALPLLARCKRVYVFEETELFRPAADTDELINYLARHDAKAERVFSDRASGSIAEHVLDAVRHTGAGLLVMGAYTHGRVRQRVFGGVTSHVLHHARIPVLLAH